MTDYSPPDYKWHPLPVDYDAEPVCHSHIDDGLPLDHPWAFKHFGCQRPNYHKDTLVHAGNNECMSTWFEFGGQAVCDKCFCEYVLQTLVLDVHEFLDWFNRTP